MENENQNKAVPAVAVLGNYLDAKWSLWKRKPSCDYNKEGFVYVMSLDCGMVKIGKTKDPHGRFKSLSSITEKNTYFHSLNLQGYSSYSPVAVSRLHLNYNENEKAMHKIFANFRIGFAERFLVPFQTAVNALFTLDYFSDVVSDDGDYWGIFFDEEKAKKYYSLPFPNFT